MNGGLSAMWTPLASTRAEAVARLAAERQAADAAVAQLLALPSEERRRRIQDEARFGTVAVAAFLLERSLPAADQDADLGEELALLAVEVLDRLDPEREGPRLLAELEAWAWGLVAYACWRAQRWEAAREALQQAEARLAGAGHPTPVPGFRGTPVLFWETDREAAVRLGRLTQAVLALVRTLEAAPVATED